MMGDRLVLLYSTICLFPAGVGSVVDLQDEVLEISRSGVETLDSKELQTILAAADLVAAPVGLEGARDRRREDVIAAPQLRHPLLAGDRECDGVRIDVAVG